MNYPKNLNAIDEQMANKLIYAGSRQQEEQVPKIQDEDYASVHFERRPLHLAGFPRIPVHGSTEETRRSVLRSSVPGLHAGGVADRKSVV